MDENLFEKITNFVVFDFHPKTIFRYLVRIKHNVKSNHSSNFFFFH